MPNEKSAIEEFLDDIPVAGEQQGQDILNAPLTGDEGQIVPVKDEAVITQRDNREARRAKKALQEEREANIFVTAKLEAATEALRFARETDTQNVDENLIRLYGNDEKGLLAAKITQDLLNKTKQEAREEALSSFREEQEQADQEVATHRNELDEMLDDIEDEFNVDLTSDSPAALKARQGFYAALQKLSPKNRDGIVTDYADPLATWEYVQSQQKPADTRAKDLGSRSMVRSGASGESKLEASSTERFLKDAGII